MNTVTEADSGTATGREHPADTGLLMPLSRRPGPLHSALIHPAGGGLGQYLRLARRLARHGPVHGIRAAGLLPGERPHDSVARMSEVYQDLLEALPRPPDLLIGWSLGGVLAWELAAGAGPGRRPNAVIMIDSYAELPPGSALVRADPLAMIESSAGGLSSGLDPERLRSTAHAHLSAALSHQVRRTCEVQALLLTCASPERAAQTARWLSLGPQLTVRELSCGHFEIFSPPHHDVLLGHIGRYIADIPDGIVHGEG
ncbi:alpha/beta fold hydrolase [Streptomyces sp. NPDC001508]|uniref:alpha/beta fold hydrolase n=1 Tax=Streptomyces sp. NPDC001508 TaxID=3154656 RepID=UPI00331A74F5